MRYKPCRFDGQIRATQTLQERRQLRPVRQPTKGLLFSSFLLEELKTLKIPLLIASLDITAEKLIAAMGQEHTQWPVGLSKAFW
jgi:hypothetical protein